MQVICNSIVNIGLCLVTIPLAFAQAQEPMVLKDSVSVHVVRRGTMPLREVAHGTITSTDPAVCMVAVPRSEADALREGETASVQIAPPNVIAGKVVRIEKPNPGGEVEVEIRPNDPLPAGIPIGTKVDSMIDIGELRDVLFFERPADSRPNAEAVLFVVEPGYARRVTVHYGQQSGPLVQILSGLSAGDHVIVTDMSRWAGYSRVQLK